MAGAVKSECSSQTLISVPPFLTKRNLLQTNIYRNRVSEPSYFATKSSLDDVAKTPKRCPPDVGIATTTTGKSPGNSRQSCVVSNRGTKTTAVSSAEGRNKMYMSKFDKTQNSCEQTLWGWTEDTKACSNGGGVSSNLGNVKLGGQSGTRNVAVKNYVNLNGAGERSKQPVCVLQSEDKLVATDDETVFVDCDTIATSAENDFRDDCPVNYSLLNATVEKKGRDYLLMQSQQTTVGDSGPHTSGEVMQRKCAGISHDASSPFKASVAFCKPDLKPDSAIPRDDPLTKTKVGSPRMVNPSTSTSTNTHVPPIDALKKLDGNLEGICASTTLQPSKTKSPRMVNPSTSTSTYMHVPPIDTLKKLDGNLEGICASTTLQPSKTRSPRTVNPSTSTSTYVHVPPIDALKKLDGNLDGICASTTLQPRKTSSPRTVNPSTSTSTYMHVPPIDALKKLDGNLEGTCASTTMQPSKTRHVKRKQPTAPLDNSFPSDRAWKDIAPDGTQTAKRVSREGKPQEEGNHSHGHTTKFIHKHDALSQKVQNMNKRKTDDSGNTSIGQQSLNSFNFYDVLDCKSKDVEELFNIQSSFETGSSDASQVSFKTVTEGNYWRSRQDPRCLHSEPRSCGLKDPPYFSGISSSVSSRRNSSLKFDPDVFSSTFSISFEKDSPLLKSVQHLHADESKYPRDTSKVSLNNYSGKMGLHRDSGKCIDMSMSSQDQFRTPSYEMTKPNDEYLLQVSSPKDVLTMSLQTFKGLSINDPRSRLDCEKFLGHKSTGEKLNNFIRSRAIVNSVSLVQSQSVTDDVKLSEENVGFSLGVSTKNEGIASAESSGHSILQCIYKSQNF